MLYSQRMDPKALQVLLEEAICGTDINVLITFKAMFGGACGYSDGVVFCSLSNVGMALKLSTPDQDALLKLGGVRLQYEPSMPPSKQYIVVPEGHLADPVTLGCWATKSVAFVQTLPAKKKPSKR